MSSERDVDLRVVATVTEGSNGRSFRVISPIFISSGTGETCEWMPNYARCGCVPQSSLCFS